MEKYDPWLFLLSDFTPYLLCIFRNMFQDYIYASQKPSKDGKWIKMDRSYIHNFNVITSYDCWLYS